MSILIPAIMGPTAVGKSGLAMELAEHLPIEIINVDSVQIYKQLNIGAGKPSLAEQEQVPHHLLNICDIPQTYSVAQFCEDIENLLPKILARQSMPLLVGGSMQYFHALQHGLSIIPSIEPEIRAALRLEAVAKPLAELYKELMLVDPASASAIHCHDQQRILRALEVYRQWQKPLSQFVQVRQKPKYQFLNINLMYQNRSTLHGQIEQRFKQMLSHGLVDEMASLLAQNPNLANCAALQTVGYKQVGEYLMGKIDEPTLLAKGVYATRQLAKRQITWLKKWPLRHIVLHEDQATLSQSLNIICKNSGISV